MQLYVQKSTIITFFPMYSPIVMSWSVLNCFCVPVNSTYRGNLDSFSTILGSFGPLESSGVTPAVVCACAPEFALCEFSPWLAWPDCKLSVSTGPCSRGLPVFLELTYVPKATSNMIVIPSQMFLCIFFILSRLVLTCILIH